MRRMRRKLAFGGAIGLIIAFAGGVAVVAQPRGDICGRSAAETTVFAELDLAHATDIWSHLPGLKGAPELQAVEGPVHVIAFNGRHMGIPAAGRTQPRKTGYDHVVCIVTEDGDTSYYSNVSFEGYHP